MTLLEQSLLALIAFFIISVLEIKGVNHKICVWIRNIFKNKNI